MSFSAEGRAVSSRQRGAAALFIEEKLSLGLISFTLQEFLQKSRLSRTAARNQLLHLGWKVVRVAPRQEFFLILSPDQRGLGAPPVAWWLDDYFSWLNRPYYLALQSAAAEYGAMPQAVQVVQVMTDKPRREVTLGKIRLKFFVKKRISTTRVELMRNAYARLAVSTREATCLDLIQYSQRIGGLESAAEIIERLAPQLEKHEVLQALATEGNSKIAHRFRKLLVTLGYRDL